MRPYARSGTRFSVVVVGLTVLAWLMACASALAWQRALKAKTFGQPNAPMVLKDARVTLLETFTMPTQLVVPGQSVRTTRVRYANRAGLAPSVFLMAGEVRCLNTSSQVVDAVAVAVVTLDAFHQRIDAASGPGGHLLQVTNLALPHGASTNIQWEQSVQSVDAYEVAVVLKRVRFADGSVWMASDEELIDVF